MIAYHHNPERLKPELKRVVTAVQVADTVCCQNELGFYLSAQTQDVTGETLELIGISEQQIGELLETLSERIQEAEQVFGE